jgi:hypothetical protein
LSEIRRDTLAVVAHRLDLRIVSLHHHLHPAAGRGRSRWRADSITC